MAGHAFPASASGLANEKPLKNAMVATLQRDDRGPQLKE
jgi:hypothetical protein